MDSPVSCKSCIAVQVLTVTVPLHGVGASHGKFAIPLPVNRCHSFAVIDSQGDAPSYQTVHAQSTCDTYVVLPSCTPFNLTIISAAYRYVKNNEYIQRQP